jgi:hypothetical protein
VDLGAAGGRLGEYLQRLRGGLSQDLPQLVAAVGADHHLVAARIDAGVGVEFAEESHGAMAHDPGGRHLVASPTEADREVTFMNCS